MDHFATAFFDLRLKDDSSTIQYLRSPLDGNWAGFKDNTNEGLQLGFGSGN
jgi:hypothetical protein